MKHYVITVEQIHNTDGTLAEYATKSDPMSEKQATSTYFNKCGAVNADLSPQGHTYMHIEIINSQGLTVKHEDLGAYVDNSQ